MFGTYLFIRKKFSILSDFHTISSYFDYVWYYSENSSIFAIFILIQVNSIILVFTYFSENSSMFAIFVLIQINSNIFGTYLFILKKSSIFCDFHTNSS